MAVTPTPAPPPAPQPGGTQIQTNDSRVLNAEWRDGRLVAAQSVASVGPDDLARPLVRHQTSNGVTLTHQHTVNPSDSSAFDYFPSVALAPNGDVGLTYMESSPTEYLSMYVTGLASGASAMETPVVAKAGEATYAGYDSSPYRAGDYSGITVDPIDGSFWAANEYAAPTNNYGATGAPGSRTSRSGRSRLRRRTPRTSPSPPQPAPPRATPGRSRSRH